MLKNILKILSNKDLSRLSQTCLDIESERHKKIKDYFDQHGENPAAYIMDAVFSKTTFSQKEEDEED